MNLDTIVPGEISQALRAAAQMYRAFAELDVCDAVIMWQNIADALEIAAWRVDEVARIAAL